MYLEDATLSPHPQQQSDPVVEVERGKVNVGVRNRVRFLTLLINTDQSQASGFLLFSPTLMPAEVTEITLKQP